MPTFNPAPCKTCKYLSDDTQHHMGRRMYKVCIAPIPLLPACIEVACGKIDIPYNRSISKDVIDGYINNSTLRNCPMYAMTQDQKDRVAAKTEDKDPNLADMLQSFREEANHDAG